MSADKNDIYQQYYAIQAGQLKSDKALKFDLYIRLPANHKYLLYRRKDSVLTEENLKKFEKFNMETLYTTAEERQLFIDYMAEKLEKEVKEGNLLGSEDSTARTLLRQTFGLNSDSGDGEQLMSNLNSITEKVVENSFKATKARKKSFAYKRVLEVAKMGTDFQKHPINTSSMSTLFAIGLGYTVPRTLADLTMGAILHDIGLSVLDPALIDKHMNSRTLDEEEQELIEEHPLKSLELLKEMKIEISQLTEQIILQHHERYDGKGYPRHLKGMMINELAFLVAFANEFDYRLHLHKDQVPMKIFTDIVGENEEERRFPPALLRKLTDIMVGQKAAKS